jgi:hypothetical protein
MDKMQKKDGNVRRVYKNLTEGMAAFVITRWAKRRLGERGYYC